MSKKIALIGQPNIFRYKNGQQALMIEMEKEIKKGNKHFIMALSTDFDLVAYDSCITLRKEYPSLQITIVINDYKYYLHRQNNYSKLMNVNHLYYPIKESTLSKIMYENNKYIIDNADKIICFYSNQNCSLYKNQLKLAKKTDKELTNAFEILNYVFKYNL